MRSIWMLAVCLAFAVPAHATTTFNVIESRTLTGALDSGGVEVVEFSLGQSGFVSANSFGSDFDTILTLVGVNRVTDDFVSVDFITENDDTVGLQSSLFTRLSAGDYAIVLSAFANFFPFENMLAPAGNFTLSYDIAELAVPLPAAAPLLATAVGGLIIAKRRRRRSA